MHNNPLHAVAVQPGNSLVKKMFFLLDFVVFPIFGLVLLFVVYQLVKSKKITVEGEEKRNGN